MPFIKNLKWKYFYLINNNFLIDMLHIRILILIVLIKLLLKFNKEY